MKLFFLLGNQLFSEKYLETFKKDHFFFMAEDYELCTYEKHHKQKILLFLSAMRSHADNLKKNKFKIEYYSIEENSFKLSYTDTLKKVLKAKVIYQDLTPIITIEEALKKNNFLFDPRIIKKGEPQNKINKSKNKIDSL